MKSLFPTSTATATATLGLALGLSFSDINPASAVTVTYYASEDTFINSSAPGTNYGNDPQLTVGRTTTGSGTSLAITSQQIPFLKFAIPTLPTTVFPGNVTARLVMTYPNNINTVRSISGQQVLQNWSEGTLTYNDCTGGVNCTNFLNPTRLFNTSVSGSGSTSAFSGGGFNQLVAGWLTGSTANNGIALRATSTFPTTAGSKQYWSSEETAPGDLRPRLEITYDEFSSLGWLLDARIGQNSPGTTNVNGSWEASTHPPDVPTVNSTTPVGTSTEVGFIWQDNTDVPFTIDWDKATGIVTTTIAGITKTMRVGTGVGTGTQNSTFTPLSNVWQAIKLVTSVDGADSVIQAGTSITTSLTEFTYQYGSGTLTTNLTGFGVGSTVTAGATRKYNEAIIDFDELSGIILADNATVLQVKGKVNIDWTSLNSPQTYTPNGGNNKIYARFEAYGPNTSPTPIGPALASAALDPQAVPEPQSIASLLALGLVGAGLRLRRKAKSS